MSTQPGQPPRLIITAPLFLKILTGILIPLTFLLFALCFMIVRRELMVEVDRCARQSEVVLKSIEKEFLKLFSEAAASPAMMSKTEMQSQLDYLKETFSLAKVDLVDPVTLVSLVNEKGPGNSTDPAILEEFSGVPDSLSAKRQGQPFYISSDVKWSSKSQAVFGYLPFKHKNSPQPYVLVTVYKTSFQEVMTKALSQAAVMFLFTLLMGFLIAIRLSFKIVRPINQINQACREMLAGKLGLQVNVHTGDEIEIMAKNFNQMSRTIMLMQRQAKDSNPLTHLPGNQWIMEELKHRLKNDIKFVFFHIDIDRFKAYNDYYGLGKGDIVLKKTGEILRECVKEAGVKGNFVGHQGGDDFVLILNHANAETIAKNVCKKFDELLKLFYEEETLKRGYFIGEESRPEDGQESGIKKHALMAITLAGVSNQNAGNTLTVEEVLQCSAGVKKRAKKIPYSKYLIEEPAGT